MAKFKSKAESSFENKVQYAMEFGDWDTVTRVGEQYEAYLQLIEEMCSYGDTLTSEGEIACNLHGAPEYSGRTDGHRPCSAVSPNAPAPMELQDAMARHPAGGREAVLHPDATPVRRRWTRPARNQ